MKKFDRTAPSKLPRCGGALFSIVLALGCIFSHAALAADPAPAQADIAMSVKNPDAKKLVLDAEKAFRSGKNNLAITLLKRAMTTSPKEAWIGVALARVQLRMGDAASAEAQLRQARGKDLSDEFILPTLFSAMQARHEEIKLLEEFPAPAENAKGAIAAQILDGRSHALLALGRTDEAAAARDRSLALNRDIGSLLGRATIAWQQNNPELAKSLIDEAYKRQPNNGHVMLAKLGQLIRSNDDTAALALSDQILKQFPSDVTTRAKRIELFLKLHQDAKAKAAMDSLSAKAPGTALTRYYQALFLMRANNPGAAWKIAQTLPPAFAKTYPEYAAPMSQMAVRSGNVEVGAAILAAALVKWPERTDLRLSLAAIRMGQNSPEAALRVLAPIKDTSDPLVLDMIGVSKLQTSDLKGSLESLTRAHDMQPKNGEITFHLVQALNANDNRNAAKTLLNSLLASGDNFEDQQTARQLAKTWR